MTPPVLRPLSLGEILDVSFGLYRTLFVPLLLVAVMAQGLPMLLSIYINAAGMQGTSLWLTIGVTLLSVIGSALASAGSTFILSENYMGRSITAGTALSRAMPFLGRVIMLSLLTTLLFFIGFLLLIVPGLILISGLVLATPALVIESRPHATDAMGRSWALTRGHRWKIFGALLITGILILLPSLALGVFAAVKSFDVQTQQGAISGSGLFWLTVVQILQVMLYPFLYCTLTVAYYDLRVRKEAFDLEVLAGGLARA
ncbi:MAG TPA: hypothetical protein VG817_05945 [Gemmatimonadales bacterium]|nr:hypothetical protein [Gemmatimonadales bacterium]